jgi:hypothetical protein
VIIDLSPLQRQNFLTVSHPREISVQRKISAHASRSNGIERDALNMTMKTDDETIANTIQFLQHHPFG